MSNTDCNSATRMTSGIEPSALPHLEAREYVQWVREDYHRALDRFDEISSSMQEDFKLFAVVLPLLSAVIAGLGGVQRFNGWELAPTPTRTGFSLVFWAFAGLITVVAAISFRDYTRALGFEHALYTVVRYERHYRRLIHGVVPAGAGAPVMPAELYVAKFQPQLGKLVMAASAVYSIPTLIAPPLVLGLLGNPREAYLIVGYSGSLAALYVVVGQLVLKRFTQLFHSLTDESLSRDDPDPPSP